MAYRHPIRPIPFGDLFRRSLGLLAAMLLMSGSAAGAEPLDTIAGLDVPRYMGRWYELARFPNWFQKHCVGDSHADYALEKDGTVRVTNRCRLADGTVDVANGVARQIGGAGSPKLEVRFAPAWLAFIPAVWGDYWIIDLDSDYSLVAVGEPRREYLWVLSRSPRIDAPAYAALLQRLSSKGFDIRKLETTRHGE